jgi:hypothetical protein
MVCTKHVVYELTTLFDWDAVAVVISGVSILAVALLTTPDVPDRAVGPVLECYGLTLVVTYGTAREELVWLTTLS